MLSGIIFVLPVIGVFGSVDRHETITWQCDVKDGDSFRMEWIEFMLKSLWIYSYNPEVL